MTIYASSTGYLTPMPGKQTQLPPSGMLLKLNIPRRLEIYCTKYNLVCEELFLL